MADVQVGGDPALVAEARGHLDRALKIKAKLGDDTALATKLAEAESRVASAEEWSQACKNGELAVRQGKEALAAGSRDEAAGHCRDARELLDRGLKCESLLSAVQDLEYLLNSAAEVEASRRAGSDCLANAQAALLSGDIATARSQHKAAGEHFAQAGASEMLAVLDAVAAHIRASEARQFEDSARRHGDELLEESSGLIKQGELVRARSQIDKARRAYAACNVEGVTLGLDRIEQQLRDAEERVSLRKQGDVALQEAVNCVGQADLMAARAAIERARSAYERAGATVMRTAVEEIEAAVSEAEAEAEEEAAAEIDAAVKAGRRAAGGLWRKAEEPETGDLYFYHTGTQETVWDRPEDYNSDDDARMLAEAHEAELPGAEGCSEDEAHEVCAAPPLSHAGPLLLGAAAAAGGGDDERTLGALDARVVVEYAVYLGIDVRAEGHLLWIAEEGLRAPLPPGYSEHVDADGTPFFCNATTQESSWEHPLDQHYRDLIAQHRAAAIAAGVAPSAAAVPLDRGSGPPPSRSGRRATVSPAPPGSSGPAAPPVITAAAGGDDDAMRTPIVMRPRR